MEMRNEYRIMVRVPKVKIIPQRPNQRKQDKYKWILREQDYAGLDVSGSEYESLMSFYEHGNEPLIP